MIWFWMASMASKCKTSHVAFWKCLSRMPHYFTFAFNWHFHWKRTSSFAALKEQISIWQFSFPSPKLLPWPQRLTCHQQKPWEAPVTSFCQQQPKAKTRKCPRSAQQQRQSRLVKSQVRTWPFWSMAIHGHGRSSAPAQAVKTNGYGSERPCGVAVARSVAKHGRMLLPPKVLLTHQMSRPKAQVLRNTGHTLPQVHHV